MPKKLSGDEVGRAVTDLPGWTADGDRSIAKSFQFADHITALGFVVRVGTAAEVMNHHPELRMVYNTVDITLNTHDAGGVTELDIALAQKIEQYA